MAIFGFLSPKTKMQKRERTVDEKDREREAKYYRNIDECAGGEKNVEIWHATNMHIAYILKTLFMHAQNEVCIFTHGFNEAIFNDGGLIMEAVKFLNKHEAKFKIAYRGNKDDVLNAKFIKGIISASSKDKVEIWDASKTTFIAEDCQFFCINDRCQFNFVKDEKGRANFGNKEVGRFLADRFIETIVESDRVLG